MLQARAQQVLALIKDTKAEITDDGKSGHVQIGAIPTIAPYFLPEVLGRFSTEFPGANLVVQELVSLAHGVSMIPEMARRRDQSDRRVYRSLVSPKPMRTIAVVWNPSRFESRLMKAFREHLHAWKTIRCAMGPHCCKSTSDRSGEELSLKKHEFALLNSSGFQNTCHSWNADNF